jgi:prepilin-type processing-associated H-X9-DG protein/prepilin-type N-terminal cleavage/methylation domain-containing protein
MSVTQSSPRVWAMSLIELLVVIAIIAILAALLLPALGHAKARAKRVQCIDHLREVGVAFVGYANDHGGRFPMAVPVSEAGSLEFAQSSYLAEGEFYFSFRHFQAAAHELVTPKLVICPADTRAPALDFATLSNSNLSYFVGVSAQFSRPGSILAGDRNLTNDYAGQGSSVRLSPNHVLRWTAELHRFKGNLLFADGHVEQRNNTALVAGPDQVPPVATLSLPAVRQSASAAPAGAGDLAWSVPQANRDRSTGLVSSAWPTPPRATNMGWVTLGGGSTTQPPAPPRAERLATNAVPAATPPTSKEEPAPSPAIDSSVAVAAPPVAPSARWWIFAVLLLLIALALVARKLARGKHRQGATLP